MQTLIKKIGSKQFLKSRAVGLAVGIAIGFIWLLYGISLVRAPYKYVVLVPGVLIAVFLFTNAIEIANRRKEMPEPAKAEVSANKKRRRLFILNFIVEIILLNIVYYFLAKMHSEQYLIPAISIVVGLHFIPMAIFLDIKQFYICAFIMIISGIIFLLLVGRLQMADIIIYQSVINACALWLTVFLSEREMFKNNFYLGEAVQDGHSAD